MAHIYYDNTIFYDGIVFGWSFVVLSIWIIITIVKVLNLNPSFVKKVVNSRPWRIFDFNDISFVSDTLYVLQR